MMTTTDNETGEVLYSQSLIECNFDMETGEAFGSSDIEDPESRSSFGRKIKFNIPKSYLSAPKKPNAKCCLNTHDTFTLASKEKVISLKEKIILGYNKTSHRLFLIPSLFLFPKIAALLISITEVVIHVWAHKKNLKNENNQIYFRSPLHALTSQFCSLCLETKSFQNIPPKRYQKKKVIDTSFQ